MKPNIPALSCFFQMHVMPQTFNYCCICIQALLLNNSVLLFGCGCVLHLPSLLQSSSFTPFCSFLHLPFYFSFPFPSPVLFPFLRSSLSLLLSLLPVFVYYYYFIISIILLLLLFCGREIESYNIGSASFKLQILLLRSSGTVTMHHCV